MSIWCTEYEYTVDLSYIKTIPVYMYTNNVEWWVSGIDQLKMNGHRPVNANQCESMLSRDSIVSCSIIGEHFSSSEAERIRSSHVFPNMPCCLTKSKTVDFVKTAHNNKEISAGFSRSWVSKIHWGTPRKISGVGCTEILGEAWAMAVASAVGGWYAGAASAAAALCRSFRRFQVDLGGSAK